MEAISFDDFLVASAAPRTFLMTYAAIESPRFVERQATIVCLHDEAGSFFLFNQILALSQWIPETGDYTEDVYESVVLAASAEAGRDLRLGEHDRFELEWPGGPMIWAPADFRRLAPAEGRLCVLWSVVGGLCFEGRACNFLLDLRLRAATGDWRVRRGDGTPEIMAIEPVPAEGAPSVAY